MFFLFFWHFPFNKFFVSPFSMLFLWSSAVIVFGGLQVLSNELTIVIFLLTLLDISSSHFSFWLSLTLLNTHLGLLLFWFSLLSIVLVFCSYLELIWFLGVFIEAVFCKKNNKTKSTSSFEEKLFGF